MEPTKPSMEPEDFHTQWISSQCIDFGDTARRESIASCDTDRRTSDASNNEKALIIPERARTRDDPLGASFASSIATLNEERALEFMPPKKYKGWCRKLRWNYFSVYRRLATIVVAINVVIMVVLGAKGQLLSMSPSTVSTAVASNIALTVLTRNELVVNLLFLLFGCCPQWMPLRIRRLTAKIYQMGGVHSGAGIASLVWFAIFNVIIIRHFSHVSVNSLEIAVLTITALLDVLLLSIIGFSHPRFRQMWHNTWEAIHRFAGWTAVALFWVHFGLLANADRKVSHPQWSILQMLICSPVFWLLLVITLVIIMPWLRLKKVPVRAEPLSDHAIRLHFSYTNLPLCAAPRLSDNPLKEWHSFAGIPHEDGFGFSVIVSRAGDWTTKVIRNPPTKLWIRSIPVRGVLHIAPIFKRMVLVATGSGIGPVLSLLYARKVECRILWSTPSPLKTYQSEVVSHVMMADPNAVIIDTKVCGRPNLIEHAYRLYKESNAEAVFVISNPKVTYKLVYALECRGVAAFAPIFDS